MGYENIDRRGFLDGGLNHKIIQQRWARDGTEMGQEWTKLSQF